jgi:uncharacterized protein YdcH (DUF465 family)
MPQKSKFFRVATEGATTDGRVINREWLTQMAKNFNPAKYGARIWLEHFRGVYPDSAFRAYGDVTAVEAREVEDKKLALFAQIEPLPELVDMVKKGQKIYTSIEITPKFADSGEAYLTGLGVTDSPASLGTEVLAFAQQKPDASPFKGRKSSPEALFTEAVEVAIELEPADDGGEKLAQKFGDTLKGILDKFKGKATSDDARFAQVAEGFETLAGAMTEQMEGQAKQFNTQLGELQKAHDKLKAEFTEQTKQLEGQRSQNHGHRPPATGATGTVQTDC